MANDKKSGVNARYKEAEAAEHAELWRDKGFRTAVEKRIKGPKAARKVTGKR